ncbi:hypothetical protein CBL_07057 [Carabus blaptoides fortunei]
MVLEDDVNGCSLCCILGVRQVTAVRVLPVTIQICREPLLTEFVCQKDNGLNGQVHPLRRCLKEARRSN